MNKRLIVKYREDGQIKFINIAVDEIFETSGMLFAMKDAAMVGVFNLMEINLAYISEEGGK